MKLVFFFMIVFAIAFTSVMVVDCMKFYMIKRNNDASIDRAFRKGDFA